MGEQGVGASYLDAVVGQWAGRPAALYDQWVRGHVSNAGDVDTLLLHWGSNARAAQCPSGSDWDVWLMMAGRGFGKTRAGAEWVKSLVGDGIHKGPKSRLRIALVGATLHEARSVMVEGESGILSLYADDALDRPCWEPSLRLLTWPNGAVAITYGAAEGEALRGPQHHYAWADEIGKWVQADGTWSNLRLGLRLGKVPRVLVTTTPRNTPLITKLNADALAFEVAQRCGEKLSADRSRVRRSNGTTHDNKSNLPVAFRDAVEAEYGGTRLGRQEIGGELITDVDGAQLSLVAIERHRIAAMNVEQATARMQRIVIAVDPPVSNHGDACGLVAVGLEEILLRGAQGRFDGRKALRAVLLEDASLAKPEPAAWADAAIALYRKWGASVIVAEGNQGGDMVRTTLEHQARDSWGMEHLPVKKVHATHGKATRAEPVTTAYARGSVVHAGRFEALEEQMCGYTLAGGYEGPGRSPDRADAMVWAVTELLLEGRGKKAGDGPRISWL